MRDKVHAWRWGVIAEHICIWVLRFQGYKILARRYKTKVGEIDIIARRFHALVFVEVKARSSYEVGLESISFKQRQRIQKTAEIFLSRSRKKDFNQMRFDVMVVVPWRWPYHLRNAWRL